MGKVSELVGKVSDFPWATAPKLSPDEPLEPGTARPSAEHPAKNSPVTFADLGARIGADNEVLRNLLIATGHQLEAIDDLKSTYSKLTEPLANLLSTLENERAAHARSQGELTALRASHEALRADFQKLEAKSSEMKADNERLNRSLTAALQKARELEDNRSELRNELATARSTIATTTKQLGDEATKVRVLSDEKVLLTARSEATDRKISGLESDLAQARERVSMLENDKSSLHTALEKTLGESSRVSRQLGETESALVQSRGRTQQLEGSLAAAEAERDKAIAASDEADERRQSEVYALELKLDGLRARCDTAEQMVANTRQTLIGRSEALRAAEARAFEASAAQKEAEAKTAHLLAETDERGQQIALLEHEVSQLVERYRSLMETQAANERALADAQAHAASVTAHLEQFQMDAGAYRARAEEEIVQLTAALEHERTERALGDAALEKAREDYDRLQLQATHHQRHFRT